MRAAKAEEIGARGLANIAYAAVQVAKVGQLAPLCTALARVTEQRMGNFEVQQLTKRAWALAKVGKQRLGIFSPQALTNTAWAFATVGLADAALFAALAKVVQLRMGGFNCEGR